LRVAWVIGIASACAGGGESAGDPTPGLDTSGSDGTVSSSTGGSDGSSASASATTSGTQGESGTDDGTSGGAVEPYACDVQPADSPVLAAQVWFDPIDPHPGDTLTVVVKSGNGLGHGDAPPMQLDVEHGGGSAVLEPTMRAGGDALYYYAIPDVAQGDVCVLGRIAGAPEMAAKITVTERPPSPPVDAGVFKVTTNHQWTCDEQPDFGNELHVWVRDENGSPLPDVVVRVDPVESADLDSLYNEDSPLPETIVTGADGHALMYVYWPITDHGFFVMDVSVDGAASDVATEITTGWWEDDGLGCRYCPPDRPVNVWGHWSHTIEFQRDPGAAELCRVPTDHAGQAACGAPGHLHHAQDVASCWAPDA